MNEIIKLQETIEYQRSKLDAMILNGIDDDSFYEANVRLDRLIERYIELTEQENISLMHPVR